MRAPSAGTLLFLTASIALAQGTITDVTDTPITFSGHADAFVAGPDGNVWLVDSAANAVGRLAVDGSAYQAFPVPTPAAGLNSIIAGPDGNLWFTEPAVSKVGRITTSGAIAEFAVPPAFVFPPYSFVQTSGTIAPGPDGNLWISGIGQMAKVTPQGTVTVVTVPPPAGIRLVEIGKCVAAPDGNLWCLSAAQLQQGPSDYRVAKLTTAGVVTLYPETFQEYDIVEAPDGNVWISAGGAPDWNLTRVTPAGVETVYALPTTRESRLAVGNDGNIWFTERTTMGNIWQMILSTATDDGHATFNSAPVGLGYPEHIVTVTSPVGASGIHTEEVTAECPASAWVLGSSASYGSNLRWVKKKAPAKCTDLVAFPNVRRGAATFGELNAGCYDQDRSPNPAEGVEMTIVLPKLDVVDSIDVDPTPIIFLTLPWDKCSVTTGPGGNPIVTCTRATLPKGAAALAAVSGSFGLDRVKVLCSSSTPEVNPPDNTYFLYPLLLGVESVKQPPVDPKTRW